MKFDSLMKMVKNMKDTWEKRNDITDFKVKREIKKKLLIIKSQEGLKNFSEVIEFLLNKISKYKREKLKGR